MLIIYKILEKIKEIEGVKSDYALTKILKVKTANITNWRKRGTIPYKVLQEYCRSKNISLDSLLSDEDEMPFIAKEPDITYNKERARVREIMKILHDHPELDEHIYHYLKSLITKPK